MKLINKLCTAEYNYYVMFSPSYPIMKYSNACTEQILIFKSMTAHTSTATMPVPKVNDKYVQAREVPCSEYPVVPF